MNDLAYHYRFVEIFRLFRDLNAEYHIPGSHACIIATSGIELDVLEDLSIVVSAIKPNVLSPGLGSISLGDELLAIDGVQFALIAENWQSSGLIAHAIHGLSTLHRIDGKTSKLPANDEITFEFERVNGQTYHIALPWIAEINDECVEQVKKVEEAIKLRHSGNSLTVRNHTDIKQSKQKQPNPIKPKVFFNPAPNSNVEWAIFEPERTNMGVITFKTFGDENNNSNDIALAVRDLLQGELANTSAVVFDVRSNPPGSLASAAELIPQLVSSNFIHTSGGTLKVHPLNERMLMRQATGNLSKWARAYRRCMPGSYYAPEVKFTEQREANALSQVYRKPVGVFTSSNCYGACEVFAATMDTNRAAIIFGESRRTGANPTNSVDYNGFLHSKMGLRLILPYVTEMPLAAPNFKISWQRFGESWNYHATRSRYIMKPILRDILNPSEWSSQFSRIAYHLVRNFTQTEALQVHAVATILPDRIYENDDPDCVACQDTLKDTIISPCGHFCLCSACCEKLGTCPMCRREIACVVRSNTMNSTSTSDTNH